MHERGRTVLHISKVKGIAGSENHLLTLLPRLRSAGYEPTTMVLRGPGDDPAEFARRLSDAGVTVETVPLRSNVDPVLLALFK